MYVLMCFRVLAFSFLISHYATKQELWTDRQLFIRLKHIEKIKRFFIDAHSSVVSGTIIKRRVLRITTIQIEIYVICSKLLCEGHLSIVTTNAKYVKPASSFKNLYVPLAW